jgi:hypothetical protein
MNSLEQESKIMGFAVLKCNWNGYGAGAVPVGACTRAVYALRLLNFQPNIAPGPSGCVHFDFHDSWDYLRIDIYEDSLLVSSRKGEDRKRAYHVANIDDLVPIVNEWHSGMKIWSRGE